MNAIAAVASRDVLKFFRDPARLAATFIFPFAIMALMGGTLQLNLGRSAGFNFIGFTFTGVLGMTIFQSSANGIIFLPQFFLAGVFSPVSILPWYLEIFSLLSPLRYVVDLIRDVTYAGRAEYHKVVLFDAGLNLLAMATMFVIFMVVGTALFVRRETNR